MAATEEYKQRLLSRMFWMRAFMPTFSFYGLGDKVTSKEITVSKSALTSLQDIALQEITTDDVRKNPFFRDFEYAAESRGIRIFSVSPEHYSRSESSGLHIKMTLVFQNE
jgi:hypothetical protein